MKYTRATALAAIAVATTLSLTACGGGATGKDTSAKGSSASGSSAASKQSPSADASAPASASAGNDAKAQGDTTSGDAAAGSARAGSGKDTEAGAANGSTGTSSKITFCRTADLAIDAVDAAPGGGEGRIDITMVNRGSRTCSATGFPGVDITDADHTSSPIERGPAQPRVTTLKPGDAAIFDLAYTVDPSGDGLTTPTAIIVTPPNETHPVTLKWPAGAGAIKGAYTDVQVYPTHTTK
ncbi:DUF4232 domain-containing protein [Streptomyces sp. NPDC049813]|uniref:DUF4232 domain-containing protein n=1 Tax=Streptomyces sp. NPDC049813 TaxID=3365597 RepID=UPI0037A189E7